MGNTRVAQSPLFPAAGPTYEDLALKQRRFIAAELRGARIKNDLGVFNCLEVMAIAAEGMAQDVASLRGDISPGAERFLSELTGARLNADGEPAAFSAFDVDRGAFLVADRVNAAVINELHHAAMQIAGQVVYEEVESQNLIAMRNGEQ